MKLPTLNVDVAVNTKTMQKGIAEANKNLEKVGKKGLSFAGGGFGKLGGLAELGGGFGMGAIGIGGIAMAALAPIKLASGVVDAFAASTKRGEEALRSFAEGKGLTGGLDIGAASRLAAGAERERANQMATQGIFDTFVAAMTDEAGQVGGLAGVVKDWAQATAEGTKWLAAFTGGVLGGLQDGYAAERADMAISRSVAGAQAYMTPEQINASAAQAEKYRKAQREQNT
jgi:hypothetical protein